MIVGLEGRFGTQIHFFRRLLFSLCFYLSFLFSYNLSNERGWMPVPLKPRIIPRSRFITERSQLFFLPDSLSSPLCTTEVNDLVLLSSLPHCFYIPYDTNILQGLPLDCLHLAMSCLAVDPRTDVDYRLFLNRPHAYVICVHIDILIPPSSLMSSARLPFVTVRQTSQSSTVIDIPAPYIFFLCSLLKALVIFALVATVVPVLSATSVSLQLTGNPLAFICDLYS